MFANFSTQTHLLAEAVAMSEQLMAVMEMEDQKLVVKQEGGDEAR